MAKLLFEQRWPWLVAAGLITMVFLYGLVEVRSPGDWELRPIGSAIDIERLAERDDFNVLFILIDTLRADRLGSYGYERETSPTLDRVADSGVRFSRHLAQSSWTKASMASLWTGLYPVHTGITRYDEVLPEAARMPAEILKEAGFQTVGLYRNGWVAPTFGFGQGFEVYQRPAGAALAPGVRFANPTLSDKGSDESVVESALEFLRVGARGRWFLYMHLMDVHEYIYDENSALFGATYSDIYDNSIRFTDGIMDTLLAYLSSMGHLDDTLIVITSDHGEAFQERGIEGHGRAVYRESTEIPFILSFPFRLESPVVLEQRTRNIDVWPTLLDLLGLEALPQTDGRSLLPDILAAARREPAPSSGGESAIAFLDQTWGRAGHAPLPTVAVAEDDLRYVRQGPPEGSVEQLFDASDDPAELLDRAGEDPEALSRLRATADAHLAEQPVWGDAPTREIDELELNLLRALGYAIP